MKRFAAGILVALAGWLGLGAAALFWPGLARAEIVLEARDRVGAVVQLHDEAGWCVDGARRAEYVSAGGYKVAGCWVIDRDGDVLLAWLNGAALMLPIRAFRPPQKL